MKRMPYFKALWLFIVVPKLSSVREHFDSACWSVLNIYAMYREDQKTAFNCTWQPTNCWSTSHKDAFTDLSNVYAAL